MCLDRESKEEDSKAEPALLALSVKGVYLKGCWHLFHDLFSLNFRGANYQVFIFSL